jgi:hypothetical protein
MTSSHLTYQLGLARRNDLRREADNRRLAKLASRDSGTSVSTSRRRRAVLHGPQPMRVLETLSQRWAARVTTDGLKPGAPQRPC